MMSANRECRLYLGYVIYYLKIPFVDQCYVGIVVEYNNINLVIICMKLAAQLNEVRKTGISRVLCDSGDGITQMQPHGMYRIGAG